MIGTKYKHFIHCYGNYARIIAFTVDCLPPAVLNDENSDSSS